MATSSVFSRAAAVTALTLPLIATNANAMDVGTCSSRENIIAQMDAEGLYPMGSFDQLFDNKNSKIEAVPTRIVTDANFKNGHLVSVDNKSGQYCVDGTISGANGGQMTILNPKNREVSSRTFVSGALAEQTYGLNRAIKEKAQDGVYVGFQAIFVNRNNHASWVTVFAAADAKDVKVNPIALKDAMTSTPIFYSSSEGKNVGLGQAVNFKLTVNGEKVARAQANK